VLEEVSDPALIVVLVQGAGINVKTERNAARRFRIAANGVAQAVRKGPEVDILVDGDVAVLVGPVHRIDPFRAGREREE